MFLMLGIFSTNQTFGQGVIATDGGVVLITFDNSTPGILNGAFGANGMSSNPGPGQLDSDGVNIDDNIPGTADVPAVFGTNDVKFANRVVGGNVSSSVDGIWGFNIRGSRTMGFQPGDTRFGGKDFGDGQIVFKFVNNTGVTLTEFLSPSFASKTSN